MSIVTSPEVSVIMPCYNGERTLHQAVRSVIDQTFPDWELLIVNDGSSDSSEDQIRQFAQADDRIRLISNSQPSGAAAARNRALDQAKGRYIAFLDCDDVWLPHKLELQLAAMKQQGAALGCSAYDVIDGNGELIGQMSPAPGILTYKRVLGNNPIGCLTVVLDRHQCGAIHFNRDLPKSEDYHLWLSILKRGLIGICLSDTLALYRVHGNTLSSNKLSAARNRWRVYREFEKHSLPVSCYYFLVYAVSGILKSASMRRQQFTGARPSAKLG